MTRILFFETTYFTGATRVTKTFAKKISRRFETRKAVIYDIDNLQKEIEVAIDREQPDILFSSFSQINPEVILTGKDRGLTVVVRSDYKYIDLAKDIKDRIIESYPKADWIIVQTPEMKDELQSMEALRNCRIKIVENPIDEEDILQKAAAPNPFSKNGNYHFLWVGRIDPIKDLQTLKNAFEIVHSKAPKTDLTLISDDPNPYRWIKNADCLVISSKSEASPNILREALFLKTKVVSTNCSQTVRDLIPQKRIAKVGDANDLAKVMLLAMIKLDD